MPVIGTMVKIKLCEPCKAALIALLDKRVKRILEVHRAENPPSEIGYGHCFHLMEIRGILEGKHTCGVYDDYGTLPKRSTARRFPAAEKGE